MAQSLYNDYKPWQHRVIQEHKELKEKLGKLIIYIDTTKEFNDLNEDDQYWLRRQREAMVEYLHVLSERITRFG